jgi:hypothetical protein
MATPDNPAWMGFDPRRWQTPPRGRPITANVEALLAENEALLQEVWALRQQLDHGRGRGASRTPTSSAPAITVERLEGWCQAMARHPAWAGLRVVPPGGLRGLVEELRRHWWNPSLTLEEELDRHSPGLGAELGAVLRGPHSRGRWAVRAAFALYGARAAEWLEEAPGRVVEELRQRMEGLERQRGPGQGQGRGQSQAERQGERQGQGQWSGVGQGAAPGRRRGTRTANHSQAHGQSRSQPHSQEPSGQQASGFSEAGAPSQPTETSPPGPGGRSQGSGSKATGSGEHANGPRASAESSGRRGPDAGAAPAREREAETIMEPPLDSRRRAALRLLGLENGATSQAIKRAYWHLAKAHHPDLGGDPEAFHRLDAAYRLLVG